MPTLTTNPIPHDLIPDAGAIDASAKLLGRQDISGQPTTLEFDIGLILNYIAANLDNTTAAELTAALMQYHKKGDLIPDTDIPSAIARDSEVSAAITAALVGYLTQTAGDARYPLLSGLPEAIDDRVGALLVAGANITLAYNDTANTLTIASSASGGGGGGHIIQDETTNLTQRSKLAFVGAGVSATDDVSGDRTVVTIPGGGGSAVNFLSLPLLVSDPGAIANQTLLFARANGNPYIRISDGTVYPLTLGASVPPIGGGTMLLQDNFNAADGTDVVGRTPAIGNSWVLGISSGVSPQIVGNKAKLAGGTIGAWAISDVGQNAYTINCDFEIPIASAVFGLAVVLRASTSSTGILFLLTNNQVDFYRYDNPQTFVSLSNQAFTTPTSGHINIVVTPTSIDVNVNSGAYTQTLANTDYASQTFVGFTTNNTSYTVDNFVVVS